MVGIRIIVVIVFIAMAFLYFYWTIYEALMCLQDITTVNYLLPLLLLFPLVIIVNQISGFDWIIVVVVIVIFDYYSLIVFGHFDHKNPLKAYLSDECVFCFDLLILIFFVGKQKLLINFYLHGCQWLWENE